MKNGRPWDLDSKDGRTVTRGAYVTTIGTGEEGHIYVMRFSNETVKVGRTTDPDERFERHKATARKDKSILTDFWVSPQHGNSDQTERKLIKFCQRTGLKHRGNEWFSGLLYDDVVKYAQTLDLAPSHLELPDGSVWPCTMAFPGLSGVENLQRDQLGLMTHLRMPDISRPNGWKKPKDMSDEEQFQTRLETARGDVIFLMRALSCAMSIVEEIESEERSSGA